MKRTHAKTGLSKIIIVFALITVVVVAALATIYLTAPFAPATEKTIVVAVASEPYSITGPQVIGTVDLPIIHSMFDTLVTYVPPDFTEIGPHLATSWEISDDGLVYTFHLRNNVTFHDGTPFNATAVKFSFERTVKNKWSAHAAYLEKISSINVTDEYTVAITLKSRYAPFMAVLAYDIASIVSPTAVAELGDNMFNLHPVATGPWKFDYWMRGVEVSLKANKEYFLGAPKADRLLFRIIPNSATRRMELEKGSVDVVEGMASDINDAVALSNNSDYVVAKIAPANYRGILVNNEDSILKDVQVRRALSMAVDRDALIRTVFQGFALPIYGPLSPAFWSHNPDTPTTYSYNATAAEQLLDAAGYPRGTDGTRFKVTLHSYPPKFWQDIGIVLQSQLRQVGIDVQIINYEAAAFYDMILGPYKLAPMGRTAGDGPIDPINVLVQFYRGSDSIPKPNYCRYNNTAYDALYTQAEQEVNATKRKLLNYEMQNILALDVPCVWLCAANLFAYHTAKLKGVVFHIAGYGIYWQAYKE